jgi:hypothetical protein
VAIGGSNRRRSVVNIEGAWLGLDPPAPPPVKGRAGEVQEGGHPS